MSLPLGTPDAPAAGDTLQMSLPQASSEGLGVPSQPVGAEVLPQDGKDEILNDAVPAAKGMVPELEATPAPEVPAGSEVKAPESPDDVADSESTKSWNNTWKGIDPAANAVTPAETPTINALPATSPLQTGLLAPNGDELPSTPQADVMGIPKAAPVTDSLPSIAEQVPIPQDNMDTTSAAGM